ncbi:MAG: SDR family oxidoreductase [Deltaproteobacteria bacterium]|nr:SDR family oxidoreductase [Deltaproteobacteria bacterium]
MSIGEITFDDRVAIITGAGGGLGKAYALELAKRGAKIVVNDLGGSTDGTGEGSASPADEVVNEIKAQGGEAVANYDNVAIPEGGENMVETAMDAFGRVDIVINNAGILRDRSFLKMEPEDWDGVVAVHLKGAYCVTRPAFKVMKSNNFGRIVMTTSGAGLYGNFGQTNYTAAKMGIIGLMNTLKQEGAKYDIKVNAVAPSAVSRLTESLLTPEMLEMMKPEFVAPMVVYLCSDKCIDTGNIYNAGVSIFSRVAIMTGPEVKVGDGVAAPSAEDIMASMDKINSLENAKVYPTLTDQMMAALGLAGEK